MLSPTNTRKEIGLKLRRYREAPDNLYAVVIEQREYLVEVHARSRDWEPVKLTDAGERLELPEFGLRCLVGDLYRGTPLNPQRAATRAATPLSSAAATGGCGWPELDAMTAHPSSRAPEHAMHTARRRRSAAVIAGLLPLLLLAAAREFAPSPNRTRVSHRPNVT